MYRWLYGFEVNLELKDRHCTPSSILLQFLKPRAIQEAVEMKFDTVFIVMRHYIDKVDYYSFKIFLCFWLAKIPRIIHHNQLYCWPNLEEVWVMWKMTSILQHNCHKTRQFTKKTWGQGWVVFVVNTNISLISKGRNRWTIGYHIASTARIQLDRWHLLLREYLQNSTTIYLLSKCTIQDQHNLDGHVLDCF